MATNITASDDVFIIILSSISKTSIIGSHYVILKVLCYSEEQYVISKNHSIRC